MKVCPECQTEYSDEQEFCSVDGMKLRNSRDGAEDPMIGRILEGRWIIEEKIGEGGMGSVYKGSQRSVNRKVAIKTLRPSLVSSDEFVDRFFREAKIATTINHPNCVTILDFGQTDDEVLYLAMEFLEGMPLADWLEQGTTLPLDQVLMVAEQVATALEAAHAQNIIHRDLKPDNVFLQQTAGKDIHAKLLDFGIAKDTGSETQFTRTGQIFGTPNYMSPEQCSGEELDGRSDLYALGCILYEMLCGKPPFDGANSMAILMAQVTENPVPPSHLVAVPEQVEQLALALLQKDRNDRPANATEARQLIKLVRYQVGAGPAPTGEIQLSESLRASIGSMDTMAGAPLTPSAPHPQVNLQGMGGAAASQSLDAMPAYDSMEPDPVSSSGGSKKGLLAIAALLGILLVGGVATAAILLNKGDKNSAEVTGTDATAESGSDKVAASASETGAAKDAEAAKDSEKVAGANSDEAPSTTPPSTSETTPEVGTGEETEEVATNDETTEETEEVAANEKKSRKKRKRRRKKAEEKKAEPPKEVGSASTTTDSDALPTFEKKPEKKVEKKKKKKDKSDAIVDGLF